MNTNEPGPRYAATIELLRAAEALWEGSRVFFDRWNLSPSQFNILNLLKDEADGLSQSQLSRELITHRSNLTGLVDRLEARGLVQRRDTPGDRRSYQVVLTAAGQHLIREILPHYYQTAEDVWGNLSAEGAHQLVGELTQVSARASQVAETLKPSKLKP
jgi:DNA-binding MarR family transcriptional regulator